MINKTYTKQQIEKILKEWFEDFETCSGLPHCNIEECDLCMNCFEDLLGRFRIEGESVSDIIKKIQADPEARKQAQRLLKK